MCLIRANKEQIIKFLDWDAAIGNKMKWVLVTGVQLCSELNRITAGRNVWESRACSPSEISGHKDVSMDVHVYVYQEINNAHWLFL